MIEAILAKRAAATAYDAMNRHDLPAVMAGLRDDAVKDFVFDDEEHRRGWGAA